MLIKLSWKQRLKCFFTGTLVTENNTETYSSTTNIQQGEMDTNSAKQLLAILQKKGRLIDFLHQNLDHYDDTQVAAVAREIHNKCQKALYGYCSIEPVCLEKENSEITLHSGFDRQSIDLTGNVSETNVLHGRLIHQGWKIKEIYLPNVTSEANLNILQPAEVEVI
ncbi:DUF2760 domain-containing protein [Fastidiosibacter lacustris]|uniref:DUF2760 domain-containing protein n=1 Tax=Fastidiosibacter lacustris TaxID=2056695 RepID=UPI000E347B3D|nr:DUF2760 domain-containing protein [Fastidiosibacter lacustris]